MITINGQTFGTANDLAHIFGKTPQTIRRWVRDGRLPHGAPHPGGAIWSLEKVAKMLNKGQASDKELATLISLR